jgi:RND family efflux transporter MFP subunit
MNLFRRIGEKLVAWGSRAVIPLAFSIGVIALLFWLAGRFEPKVSLRAEGDLASEHPASGTIVKVRRVPLPLIETAVGTVQPVHEITIGAKLLARIVEVNLKAGQTVKAGDVLVRLDDSDLLARRRQLEAVLDAARARHVQAEADANRAAQLQRSNAISQQEHERAETALKSADAEIIRAEESINEIQAMLSWATIRSPIDGIVIDKKGEVGDMATPGQTLATLFDAKRMQLVAVVRESLAHRLKVGQPMEVHIETFGAGGIGTISEIVPEADPTSRAFQVKVTGPCPEGIYSGMFGRILIPLDDELVLVIPRQAVQSIGQLDLVNVSTHGSVSRRAVRLGRAVGDDVEVLSGLREGEAVQVQVSAGTTRGAAHG